MISYTKAKYMALTNILWFFIEKLRLSVTKQTFKQKTTLQGSESAESHWYLIGVAYYFTNYNYTLYMDINWIRHFSLGGAQTELVTCRRSCTEETQWTSMGIHGYQRCLDALRCRHVMLCSQGMQLPCRKQSALWLDSVVTHCSTLWIRLLWIKLKYFSKFGAEALHMQRMYKWV